MKRDHIRVEFCREYGDESLPPLTVAFPFCRARTFTETFVSKTALRLIPDAALVGCLGKAQNNLIIRGALN